MSTPYKIIIPLLDKNITKDMISKEAGFVDAFSEDINKPFLDHHIFLMYDLEIERTPKVVNRMCKFAHVLKTKPYLHKINGHWYQIYALPKMGAANLYTKFSYPIMMTEKDDLRLIDFWGTSDDDINHYILRPESKNPKFESKQIPEEDYVEE